MQFSLHRLFYTRMIGMWNLSSLRAKPQIILSGSKCSPVLCLPGACRHPRLIVVNSTRAAAGQFVRKRMLSRVVSTQHAPLYPNAGDEEIAIAAREAGSRPVRKQMLAHCVLASRAATPDRGNVKSVKPIREAANQSVRKHMFPPAEGAPE